MADLPISGLPSAGALSGSEPLAIVQAGATKQTTVQDVANLAGSGTVTSVNSGINISVDNTNPAAPIINSLADRYKTTSLSSILIGNGSRTFTVDANLAYIPLQEVLIVYDASNHMHGTVTSYSGTTLVVDVKNHTGSGTYASWVINLDGIPVDAITGVGTVNRLAYFTAAQVIDDAAAITAARALKSDANGIPTHFDTATEPSLTELSYVKGVTSAIQTQLNGKENTITTLPISKGGTNSTTALNNNRVIQSSGGAIVEASAITSARALISDANGIPTHSATTSTELGYVSGVTSAIQTQINNNKPIVVSTTTDGTNVTGTITNTITSSILIPANTFTVGEILQFEVRVRKVGTAGTCTIRLYLNTTAAIGGSTVADVPVTGSTFLSPQIIRTAVIKSSTNTEFSNSTNGAGVDWQTSFALSVSTFNINWTVDQYLVCAIQNTNSGDASRSSYLLIRR